MPDAWDSIDGKTQHLDENGNTVGAVASDAQGIPLVLHQRHEWRYIDAEVYPDREVTHVAHALDAASVAARREAVAAACIQGANAQLDDPSRPWQAFAADAVLKALGLGGDS